MNLKIPGTSNKKESGNDPAAEKYTSGRSLRNIFSHKKESGSAEKNSPAEKKFTARDLRGLVSFGKEELSREEQEEQIAKKFSLGNLLEKNPQRKRSSLPSRRGFLNPRRLKPHTKYLTATGSRRRTPTPISTATTSPTFTIR